MGLCHMQILTNFTYHVLYKPIFMGHEFSHQPLPPVNQRLATNWNCRHHGPDLNDCSFKDVKDDGTWFLGSSSLVIINQDKNVMQRIQPTTLFNLYNIIVLYYWFWQNGTHNSRVSDILQDKSCFTSISGFTDHVCIMENFMCQTLNMGLIMHHA